MIAGLSLPTLGGGVREALSLDFLNSAFVLNNGGQQRTSWFPNLRGVSISRSSVGYAENADGTLTLFQANEPRIGRGKGLLVEEARTNLAVRSQEFDNAAWTGQGSAPTVTANQAVAPDGTTTADRIQFPAADSRLAGTLSVTSGTAYTASVYVRAVSGTATVRIAIFDSSATGISTDQTVGTTWTRITVTHTATATSGAGNVQIRTGSGSAAADVYVWGAQVEAGSFATSYIPTTSASATRAADSISISGLVGIGATSPFTLLVDSLGAGGSAIFVHARLWSGVANNYHQLAQFSSATTLSRQAVVGGVTQISTNATITSGAAQKSALTFDGDRYQAATNGTVGTAATGKTSIASDIINIGHAGGANQLNNYIRRVLIYPRAFSDAELQAATQ